MDFKRLGKIAKFAGTAGVIVFTVIGAMADVPEAIEAAKDLKKPELPGPTSEEEH